MKMHAKKMISIALVLLGYSLLSPSSSAEESLSFNVGVVIPLTGDLADYGTSIQRGIQLAVDQHPAKFNGVRFTIEDSKYDGKTAVSALQKLRSNGNISLLYAWGVTPTEAIIPIAESAKLPTLVETTIKESTTNKHYVVRAARTGERIAKALAAELLKRRPTGITVLNTDIPFYNDILFHLKSELSNQVTFSSTKMVLPSEVDLRSHLLGLKQNDNQAIGAFLLPSQFPSFFRSLMLYKHKPIIFSADIIGSESILANCGDNIDGTFFSEVGITKEFKNLYSQRFGQDGHIGHAAQAFDMANLVSSLFGDLPGKLSPDEIMALLSTMKPHNGATGTLHYRDSIESGKEIQVPVALKVIRSRKIETVTEDAGV